MSDLRDPGPPRPADDDTVALALGLATASREKADALLDEQRDLVRLQKEQVRLKNEALRDQDAFELSHLRWRRFDDRVRGVWQTGLALLVVSILVCAGAAVWNASHAEGLVVGAFSVPPRLTEAGITGEVVANDLTSRLAAIGQGADTYSWSKAGDVQNGLSDEFKVQIPETGVSLDAVWRALKSWFGHERKVSGDIRALGDGDVALTVALDGRDAGTFTGRKSELAKLEQKASERIFAFYRPIVYNVYL
ncbi:MAG: hypothetical protein ACP5QR_08925 [Rhizomicrobium sp.]